MFDLFRSREKSVRIVLGGVLLMVAASMLLYLVPSYNTGMSGTEGVVAEVAGHDITVADVRQMIEKVLKGRQLPPEVLPNYIPRMVDQMISDRALEYAAGKLGFEVTDQDVANNLRQYLPPELFPNGKFAGKEAYAMFLAQQNLTMGQFESDLRRQILIHRMMDVAVEGSVVSELEIQRTFEARNEKIRMQYVKLVADKYKKESEPSVEDMKAYFNLRPKDFQVPPQRSLAILYQDPARVEASLTPADNDLQTLYKQNPEQFRVAERVKVRHILLKTQGKPASEEPKMKAQADDILRQVKSGAKFELLVEKFSEDPGSKANAPGREPGLGPGEYWVERNGQMVKEFTDAAFTLKPGQSDVIRTTYGYHVIQVMEHQDARIKPFDEVRADLTKQWKTQHATAIEQAASDKAETELRANPAHPEDVAKKLDMELLAVANYIDGQPVPEIGVNPEFGRSVEGLKLNEVSPAVSLAGNKLAVAVVTAEIPARQKTFDEAEPELHDRMLQARLATALPRHAQELYDKAKAMNGDLEGAAKSLGLEVKTSEEFSRSGTIKDLDSATYFEKLFLLPDGAVYNPIPLAGSTVVAKVIAHVPADPSEMAAQRATLRDAIKSKKAQDRNELFEAGVVSDLERRGIVKRHKDVIDRLVAAYASKG